MIGTRRLEEGEIITLVSALCDLEQRMMVRNTLGSDEVGEQLRIGYLERARHLLLELRGAR